MAKIFTFFYLAFITFTTLVLKVESQEKIVELQELDPVQQAQIAVKTGTEAGDGKERDKRLFVLKKIGLKAGLVDLVFGKIDSFIDSKTRYINELDKQNIIKNEKYFGITVPPPTPPNNLVNNLLSVKKNLLGQAVSSFIQAKLGQVSGSLGFGSSDDSDGGSGGGLGGIFQASAGILPGLSGSFGASASLPGVGGASFGTGAGGASFGASAGTGGASFGASAGTGGASFGADAGTGGASFGASAGTGGASFGASAGTGGASFGASAGPGGVSFGASAGYN